LVSATEWMEPQYVGEDVSEPALIEEGGVPVSVSGRKGMVTYISPARHVQTSGIVYTPPPRLQVNTVVAPRPAPEPIVIAQPLYVQPVYRPHSHAHVHGHHHHSHHHHHHSVESALRAPFVSAAGSHFGHRHSRRHRHHLHARGDLALHLANGGGRVGGAGIVHTYSPSAVPVSLLNQAPHPVHYGHKSDSVSHGIITVPHGPRGKIAMEEPDFTGYNPGPSYQYNSIPTGHYSDGTAYPATIDQRFA